MNQRERLEVNALWLHFKAYAQFAKSWETVRSRLEIRARLRGEPCPKSNEDLDEAMPGLPGGATFRWMELTDGPPPAFIKGELGIGTRESYFDVRVGLEQKNAARAERHRRTPPEEERTLIKRTVKM